MSGTAPGACPPASVRGTARRDVTGSTGSPPTAISSPLRNCLAEAVLFGHHNVAAVGPVVGEDGCYHEIAYDHALRAKRDLKGKFCMHDHAALLPMHLDRAIHSRNQVLDNLGAATSVWRGNFRATRFSPAKDQVSGITG